MGTRILIVDDEPNIAELLGIVLRREGIDEVFAADTAREALRLADLVRPDLIVLDVMLPDGDGFHIATRLRESTDVPILFLTARTEDIDKLMGFGVGGDDYVTKPFNPLEVVARIKAHLRRAQGVAAEMRPSVRLGRVTLEEESGRLLVDGVEIPMPAREFRLLCFLAANPDRVFSTRQLYREVWGEEPVGSADDNTVTVHIRRIREKIEVDPGDPELVFTVRGMGYKLVPPGRRS